MKHLVALTLLLTLNFNIFAESPEAKGFAIAKEVDTRDLGYGDFKAELNMLLKNKHGQKSQRRMQSKSLEVKGDGDKTMIVFQEPRDVKGTAFLSYTHATRADDQWIYLPALKRVKRISSSNKSGPFMGSEFAYEDITSQELDKYKYKFISEGTHEGKACYIVEYYPQYKHSGYTKLKSWIDKERYILLKVDFYDRKDELFKTLTYSGYRQYVSKFWRPDKMEMLNHQTGKHTTLVWKNYKFRNGYGARDFHKNNLKKAR